MAEATARMVKPGGRGAPVVVLAHVGCFVVRALRAVVMSALL